MAVILAEQTMVASDAKRTDVVVGVINVTVEEKEGGGKD